VPGKDGSWLESHLPGTLTEAYAPGVNDRRFILLICTLSALSVMLLSIALFFL
jgi:hypothetical protein